MASFKLLSQSGRNRSGPAESHPCPTFCRTSSRRWSCSHQRLLQSESSSVGDDLRVYQVLHLPCTLMNSDALQTYFAIAQCFGISISKFSHSVLQECVAEKVPIKVEQQECVLHTFRLSDFTQVLPDEANVLVLVEAGSSMMHRLSLCNGILYFS